MSGVRSSDEHSKDDHKTLCRSGSSGAVRVSSEGTRYLTIVARLGRLSTSAGGPSVTVACPRPLLWRLAAPSTVICCSVHPNLAIGDWYKLIVELERPLLLNPDYICINGQCTVFTLVLALPSSSQARRCACVSQGCRVRTGMVLFCLLRKTLDQGGTVCTRLCV